MEKLKYLELIEQRKLNISDLPEEAKGGIEDIENVLKFVKMQDKQGKQVSQKVFNKIARLDKWTYLEILDYVNDTDANTGQKPENAAAIINEIKKEDAPPAAEPKAELTAEQKLGLHVESELAKLHQAGTVEISLDAIKSSAPKCYDLIFDSYKEGDSENGIITSRYTLLETKPKLFTLTKI